MIQNTFKWAVAISVATGIAFTGAAVLGRQAPDAPGAAPPREFTQVKKSMEAFKKAGAPAPGTVGPGGMMPGGPVAYRMVTVPVEPGRSTDPKTLQILARLEEPISMSFANETPLEDVLKYIKQATTSPTYTGIPIYVDPIGLQTAERSLNSTIQIDLEGVPLRRTLQLVLTQLGLAYFVEDGILVITEEELARHPLPPCSATPAPTLKMVEKAERGEMSSTELKELIEVMRLQRQVKLMHENMDAPYGGSSGGGGFDGGDSRVFPGEEKMAEHRELIKEIHELIELLKKEKGGAPKAEKAEKKPTGNRQ